jgi:t-SNARE complex subunit (syntaxin)
MSSIVDKQEDRMSSILDKHSITLQGKIDERVETGLTKAKKSLTVRFNAAQEQTGKRIDDVAGQASALSKRLDNDQAARIQKTKDTNLEQETKVSRKFETVVNEMDLRFQKVEKKTNTVSDKITALGGRVTNLEKLPN